MAGLVVVTVLIGGVPVPSSPPAFIRDGIVVVPVDPIVRELAEEVTVDAARRTVAVRLGERSAVVRLSKTPPADPVDPIYVPLAPIVRGLGGTVRFDAVRKVAAVEMPPAGPVASPTPFDPANPSVAPRTIFTPQPIPTRRPSPSGHPQPRRTPIPVVPSFPVIEGR